MKEVVFAALNGFMLGASLLVVIGPQNAFVLRQGLKREFVFAVSFVCAVSDALLIATGVASLGTLISKYEGLLAAVSIGGAAFLFAYGAIAFRNAIKPKILKVAENRKADLKTALLACLAFTFLNPGVYLDTVVLLGSLSARYEGVLRLAYGLGAVSASALWFFALGYGARLLIPIFADPRAWRLLDIGIGLIMWLIALQLILGVL